MNSPKDLTLEKTHLCPVWLCMSPTVPYNPSKHTCTSSFRLTGKYACTSAHIKIYYLRVLASAIQILYYLSFNLNTLLIYLNLLCVIDQMTDQVELFVLDYSTALLAISKCLVTCLFLKLVFSWNCCFIHCLDTTHACTVKHYKTLRKLTCTGTSSIMSFIKWRHHNCFLIKNFPLALWISLFNWNPFMPHYMLSTKRELSWQWWGGGRRPLRV